MVDPAIEGRWQGSGGVTCGADRIGLMLHALACHLKGQLTAVATVVELRQLQLQLSQRLLALQQYRSGVAVVVDQAMQVGELLLQGLLGGAGRRCVVKLRAYQPCVFAQLLQQEQLWRAAGTQGRQIANRSAVAQRRHAQ